MRKCLWARYAAGARREHYGCACEHMCFRPQAQSNFRGVLWTRLIDLSSDDDLVAENVGFVRVFSLVSDDHLHNRLLLAVLNETAGAGCPIGLPCGRALLEKGYTEKYQGKQLLITYGPHAAPVSTIHFQEAVLGAASIVGLSLDTSALRSEAHNHAMLTSANAIAERMTLLPLPFSPVTILTWALCGGRVQPPLAQKAEAKRGRSNHVAPCAPQRDQEVLVAHEVHQLHRLDETGFQRLRGLGLLVHFHLFLVVINVAERSGLRCWNDGRRGRLCSGRREGIILALRRAEVDVLGRPHEKWAKGWAQNHGVRRCVKAPRLRFHRGTVTR